MRPHLVLTGTRDVKCVLLWGVATESSPCHSFCFGRVVKERDRRLASSASIQLQLENLLL